MKTLKQIGHFLLVGFIVSIISFLMMALMEGFVLIIPNKKWSQIAFEFLTKPPAINMFLGILYLTAVFSFMYWLLETSRQLKQKRTPQP